MRVVNGDTITAGDCTRGADVFGKVAAARAKARLLASAAAHGTAASKPSTKASRGRSLKAAVASLATAAKNSRTADGAKGGAGSGESKIPELFAKQFVADIVKKSARAQEQVEKLDELWPDIIRDLVRETVNNFHNMDEWMSTLDTSTT